MALTSMQIKDLLDEGRQHQCDGYGPDHACVAVAAIADLPSRFGEYKVVAFYNNRDDKEHTAFIHGDVCEMEDVAVRLHSVMVQFGFDRVGLKALVWKYG